MNKIFSGKVYDILPLTDGIVFSYCKSEVDGKVIVAYKMISFELKRFTDVAKNIYLITKFGSNYKAVSALCDNYITAKSVLLPGGRVFLLLQNGTASLLDSDGAALWTGLLSYRGMAPSDIVFREDALWASYSQFDILLKYNLVTMREELKIGGARSPFKAPKGLFAEGELVTVCNSGSMELKKINLDTYDLVEGEKFEEPVYQYVSVGNNRFVLLESGLYII